MRKKVAVLDAAKLLEQAERQHKQEVCGCPSPPRIVLHPPLSDLMNQWSLCMLAAPSRAITRLLLAVAALRCVAPRAAATCGAGEARVG